MITQAEKSMLRQLIQSPTWSIIERLAQKQIDKIKTDSYVKETEFETIKTVLLSEGQIQGITNLINYIYNTQNDN